MNRPQLGITCIVAKAKLFKFPTNIGSSVSIYVRQRVDLKWPLFHRRNTFRMAMQTFYPIHDYILRYEIVLYTTKHPQM